jgi:RNA polymerase sigma-70 factor, ECF subfamily
MQAIEPMSDSTTLGLADAFRRHSSPLLRLALLLSKDGDEAPDLVQDTFERALRSPGPLLQEESAGRQRRWLEQILRNLFIDRWRQNHARPIVLRPAPDDLPDPAAAEPGQAADARERWSDIGPADLERAIAQLPEPLLTTFTLRHLHKVSYEQLSSRLNVPLGTVASRLLRARQRLRGLLLPACYR